MAISLSVGGFLPDIELRSAPDGTPVQLRASGGKTAVVVMLHSAMCAACAQYLASLAPLAEEFAVWDGRLLVVVPGPQAEAASVRSPYGLVLADERQLIANPESASVVVADRYGQIFGAESAGGAHDLTSVRDLAEWLKYLGTLCPE